MTTARPRRVLQIVTRLIVGGAQETAILTADRLRQRGWDVRLLFGPETGPEGSLAADARARGLPCTVERSLVRRPHPVHDLTAFLRLRRHIRLGCYDVVHTHSSKAGIIGRWAAWAAGAPVVVHTVHGWGFHSGQPAWARYPAILLERATAPITDRLVAVARETRDAGVQARIGRPDVYTVVRSAIDVQQFRPIPAARTQVRLKWNVPAAAPLVGTVTRLAPQKDPLTFVRAAAAVAARHPTARFAIVGDGPMRASVEGAIRNLGLTERFILAGLRDDVPATLAALDVFVSSSAWEGLARTVLQAMTTGLPVVSTRVGGHAEIVRDGETGRLVPAGDPAALATAILALLEDPTGAAAMGEAGRRALTEEFALETMIDRLETLYEALLRGAPRR